MYNTELFYPAKGLIPCVDQNHMNQNHTNQNAPLDNFLTQYLTVKPEGSQKQTVTQAHPLMIIIYGQALPCL